VTAFPVRPASVVVPLFLAVLGTVALQAAEFWERLQPEQWSRKQAEELLQASPWARVVELPVRAAPGQPIPTVVQAGTDACANCDPTGRSFDRELSQANQLLRVPTLRVRLLWLTALPIREALGRLSAQAAQARIPAGVPASEAASYCVLAAGPLPVEWVGPQADALRQKAELRVRDGRRLLPVKVQAKPAGEAFVEAQLFFSRAEVEQLEEREVVLVLDFGRHKIRQKFNLARMVYRGKLEI